MEFFVNLGDWPLENRKISEGPKPLFSWCGSDDSRDIIMPTYDLAESSMEMMSRFENLFQILHVLPSFVGTLTGYGVFHELRRLATGEKED